MEQLNDFLPKLIERVNDLSENDWSSPSRCEDWTVKEVIYHLTSALTMYFHVIDTAKNAGDIQNNPNINYREPGTADGKSNAGSLSKRIKEASKNFKTNKKLAYDFETTFSRLLRAFNSCQDHHWSLTAYHPVNWVSVHEMLLWTLFESSIHAWDALNAVDDEYIVDGNLAPLLPEYFSNKLINRWFKTPERSDSMPKTIIVNFGRSDGLLISSERGTLDIEECKIGSFAPDAVIHSTHSEFALLITGRKHLSVSIEDSTTQFHGNKTYIDSFTRWFTGS